MKPLAYISLSYESYQYDRIEQIAMLQDSSRSRVIVCHSREIGNILLYYYHLEYIKWWKGKQRPGRDMVWILVGVRGCVLRPTEHSLVTLFPCLCQLRTNRCIGFQAGHRLIILNTYLCMSAGKTCYSLVMGSGSFQTYCQGGFWVEVLAPH